MWSDFFEDSCFLRAARLYCTKKNVNLKFLVLTNAMPGLVGIRIMFRYLKVKKITNYINCQGDNRNCCNNGIELEKFELISFTVFHV